MLQPYFSLQSSDNHSCCFFTVILQLKIGDFFFTVCGHYGTHGQSSKFHISAHFLSISTPHSNVSWVLLSFTDVKEPIMNKANKKNHLNMLIFLSWHRKGSQCGVRSRPLWYAIRDKMINYWTLMPSVVNELPQLLMSDRSCKKKKLP